MVNPSESDGEAPALAWLGLLGRLVRRSPTIVLEGRLAEGREQRAVALPRGVRDSVRPRLVRGGIRVKVVGPFSERSGI
jgi:hypothetical protein